MAKKIDGAKVRRRKEAMRGTKTIKQRPFGRTFDGVSRPSNDLYRENFNRIFGKK